MSIEFDMLDLGEAAFWDPAPVFEAVGRPDVFVAAVVPGAVFTGRLLAHRLAGFHIF